MTTYAIHARERPGVRSRAWHGFRSAAASTARALLRPHRAALASLTHIPLTVAGFGFLAAAAFAWQTIAGLTVSGVLLIALEMIIADDPS